MALTPTVGISKTTPHHPTGPLPISELWVLLTDVYCTPNPDSVDLINPEASVVTCQ